jgi:hypothetical protein
MPNFHKRYAAHNKPEHRASYLKNRRGVDSNLCLPPTTNDPLLILTHVIPCLLLSWPRKNTRCWDLIEAHPPESPLIPRMLPPLACLLVHECALTERIRAPGWVYCQSTLRRPRTLTW